MGTHPIFESDFDCLTDIWLTMPIDYSKWNNIEISDDEDDTHPNIHTPSLFKWRHEARVQRMEEMSQEKERISEGKKQIQMRLKNAESEGHQTKELEKQLKEWKVKEAELTEKEKKQPLNVDTIGAEAWSKSQVNKVEKPREKKSEEEIVNDFKLFSDKYGEAAKKFGLFSKMTDSKQYLVDNTHLVSEHTASILCVWCIDLQEEGKEELMKQVSHQAVVLQFILELARSIKVDPRGCFRQFFEKFKNGDNKQYQEAFNDELNSFRGRVRERAEIRKQTRAEEQEEYNRKVAELEEEEAKAKAERIAASPGGLDPEEVMNSLPKDWQECFEKQDIQMLQNVVEKMDKAEATEHLNRCIKSGLWVPGAADEDEEVYEEPIAGENQ